MERIAWSRRAADELWSGVVSPLTFSLLSGVMAERMVRRRLERAGLGSQSRAPVFRRIRGRVYVNATLIVDVLREVPSVFRSEGLLALLPQGLRPALRETKRGLADARTVRTVLSLVRNEDRWTPWARARLFDEACARVVREHPPQEHSPKVPPDLGDPEAILAAFAEAERQLGDYLDVVSWVMIYAYVFFHLAAHLSEAWLDEDVSSWMARGVTGVRTFEVHEQLESLADRASKDAALSGALAQRSSRDIVAAARRGELGSFGRDLLDLCARHGHRLVSRDLVHPTWGERPEVLVEMVQRIRSAERGPGSARGRAKEALPTGTVSTARRGVKRRLLELGLSWCREYYAARENMRYHADYYLSDLRKLALASGELLVDRGALRETEDVFYLTMDELRGALLDHGSDVSERAALRKVEALAYGTEVLPELVWGEDTPAPGNTPVAQGPSSGTPASPGTADGPARVVGSAGDLEAVQAGDVLVAAATDPTWTSYLSLASAIVLEVGGQLSHGAIVARELGIPAVVGVSGATACFRSGERLRVDGTTGLVERV